MVWGGLVLLTKPVLVAVLVPNNTSVPIRIAVQEGLSVALSSATSR